jgi:hypothetical protein
MLIAEERQLATDSSMKYLASSGHWWPVTKQFILTISSTSFGLVSFHVTSACGVLLIYYPDIDTIIYTMGSIY